MKHRCGLGISTVIPIRYGYVRLRYIIGVWQNLRRKKTETHFDVPGIYLEVSCKCQYLVRVRRSFKLSMLRILARSTETRGFIIIYVSP